MNGELTISLFGINISRNRRVKAYIISNNAFDQALDINRARRFGAPGGNFCARGPLGQDGVVVSDDRRTALCRFVASQVSNCSRVYPPGPVISS